MDNLKNTSTANKTSGNNIPFWLSNQQEISFTKLQENIDTDILIVGGGIAGLTTAYQLLKSGRKVTIIEDGYIGSGESGRTTAHLSCALDDRYYSLSKTFGEEASRLVAESHMAAIKMIENIVKNEHIDCHFKEVDGYLFLDPSDKKENLEKELEATQMAGINTSMVLSTPGISNNIASIKFPSQAQFHILKYLKGLCSSIEAMGGRIFTETRGEDIDKNGAKANGFEIKAQHIVVATNTPINDILTMHTKQAAYRSYVIAGKIPKGSLPYSLWWDTGNLNSHWVSQPYHYVRLEELDNEFDLLICGGEDHKTGQDDEDDISQEQRYINLEKWTKTHFPVMLDIIYSWSGQVMKPVDSLGFMGKNPGDENIYIITGDSGNGMTHTTIGAMIITDIINGVKNPWEELYNPARITLNAAKDFIRETVNMASNYLDWIKAGDLESAEQLKMGEGGIISGIPKIAAYRDENNILHTYSAVCPHLGCMVNWNENEKSFDCPCHGSRFSCDGVVINGPSKGNLTILKTNGEN